MSDAENPTPETPQAPEAPEEQAAEASYPPPPPPPPPRAPITSPAPLPQKTPILAGLLSVVPGLGHVYNGLYQRAVAFFLIYVTLFAAAINVPSDGERAFIIPCLVFFWLFNLFDAYRQAALINYGYSSSSLERPPVSEAGSLALIPGIALLVVGTYGLARRFFDFELRWLLEQWPFLLIFFGGFLIWQAIKARRYDSTLEEES